MTQVLHRSVLTSTPISLCQKNLPALSDRIRVRAYLKQGQRSSLTSSVAVIGASSIARSVICPMMARAGEASSYQYGVEMVSTRSPDVVEALQEQDLLYAVVKTSPQETRSTLNGVITGAYYALERREEVLEMLASEDIRHVFLTITKGGYNLQTDVALSQNDFDNRPPNRWLDFSRPEIAHDVQDPHRPDSAIGYVLEALRRRKERDLPPFAVIPCENLPRSGQVAKRVILALAEEQRDAGAEAIHQWIDKSVEFIDAVVDRITPAARLEESREWLLSDRQVVAARPVTCEPYRRLVLSRFRNEPEGWREAGIEFMDAPEVEATRLVKQGLVNGSHAVIGFVGSLCEHRLVHEAVKDERLRQLISGFMEDIQPSLIHPPGFDFEAFRDQTLERFDNNTLPDELARVGRQRSHKVQQYVLQNAAKLSERSEPIGGSIFKVIALWVLSLTEHGAEMLQALPEDAALETKEMCEQMFQAAAAGNCHLLGSILISQGFFPEQLKQDTNFKQRLCQYCGQLSQLVDKLGVVEGTRKFLKTTIESRLDSTEH